MIQLLFQPVNFFFPEQSLMIMCSELLNDFFSSFYTYFVSIAFLILSSSIICHSLFLKRHYRTLAYFKFLFDAKNIKAEYHYVDHASRFDNSYHEDYEEKESCITLDSNSSLYLEPIKDINKIVSFLCQIGPKYLSECDLLIFVKMFDDVIREDYSESQLKQICLGVKHIIHNRHQEKNMDEAHWFKIELFKLDLYTRLLLDKIYLYAYDKDIRNINQPKQINKMYPYITTCKLFCNVSYREDYTVVYYQYDTRDCNYNPLIEINLDEFIFNSSKMPLDELKDAIINYSTKYLEIDTFSIKYCYVTDIGIENGELTIFAEIRLKRPYVSSKRAIHSITRKELLYAGNNKFSNKLYHSLSNLFIRNI